MTKERAVRIAGPPALLLALAVPFLGHAHHIDDPLYLETARQVLAAPADPMGGASLWHERPGRLFDDLYNPPMVAYLLAPVVAAAGPSEWAVHLMMVLLAVLAVVVAGVVTRKLGQDDRWVWLFAASPILVVTSTTAAADVPFLLFSLLSWWAVLAGRAGGAGIAAAASVLTKYAGGINVALVAFLAGSRRRALVAAAVAGGIFLIYTLWTASVYGEPHPRAASRFLSLSPRRIGECLAHFVAGIGLVGLPAALPLLRWSRAQVVATAIAAAAAALLMPDSRLIAALAFGTGTAILWAAIRATRPTFPAAAFWLYTTHAVVLVYFGAARYWLVALPPLLWLLVAADELRMRGARRFQAAIGLGAALGLAVAWADAAEANRWRDAAQGLPKVEGGSHTGRWGFDWYARAQGYATLAPRRILEPGEVVAIPGGIHTSGPSPAQRSRLVPWQRQSAPAPALRVMGGGAGLYSSAWGILPIAWRPGASDPIELFRVAELPLPPPTEETVLDLGTPAADLHLLDGWSGAEAFVEGGATRTFTWSLGREAAFVARLPDGATHLILTAFAADEAIGLLKVEAGPASAMVVLKPGWRTYEAFIAGKTGGPSVVILRLAGFHRPGLLEHDRRERAVAFDRIVFVRRTP